MKHVCVHCLLDFPPQSSLSTAVHFCVLSTLQLFSSLQLYCSTCHHHKGTVFLDKDLTFRSAWKTYGWRGRRLKLGQKMLDFLIVKKLTFCSETMLTGESQLQKCGCIPGMWNCCPSRREANSWPIGPVRLFSGVGMQELHRAPPSSKGSRPYGILSACRINLWEWNWDKKGG
jgi:hypothetical protein